MTEHRSDSTITDESALQVTESDLRGLLRTRVFDKRTLLSFAVALAILFVFIARADIDLSAIFRNVRHADLKFVAAAITCHFLVFFIRGQRWQVMLNRMPPDELEGVTVPPVRTLSEIILISWAVNCLVPAKLGDFYRGHLLKVESKMRYAAAMGSIVTERIFDLVVLFLLLTLSALFAFHGDIPGEAISALSIGVALILGGVIGLSAVWLLRHRIEERLPARFRNQLSPFMATIIYLARRPGLPLLLTAVIWSVDGVRLLLVGRSVGERLDYSTALFVALMGALLTTIPFTPAGLGVVEVASISVLTLVGVDESLAGSIALIDRLITYWGVIAAGLLIFLIRYRRSSVEDIETRGRWEQNQPSSST